MAGGLHTKQRALIKSSGKSQPYGGFPRLLVNVQCREFGALQKQLAQ
jgi:hypothetical protein